MITIQVIVFLCIYLDAFAQTDTIYKAISVGKQLPEYNFKSLLNYPSASAKTTDFKGKILILDFWETSCTSCIASWPKLIALQKKFKDQIQIVTINPRENIKVIIETIKRQEKIHNYNMTLPVSYGDPRWKEIFPYASLPHVVFIDENQLVKYITAGNKLNEATITSMINKQNLKMFEKTDEYMNIFKRLYLAGNTGKKDSGQHIVFSSTITPYSPEIPGAAAITDGLGNTLGFFGNLSVKDMYRILFGRRHDFNCAVPESRVLFKDIDSVRYVTRLNGALQEDNLYTIQVLANKFVSMDQMKKKMYSDLELYFNVRAYWGKQKKRCLVISRSKYPLTEYKEGKSTWLVYGIAPDMYKFNKISIQNLIDIMERAATTLNIVEYPVIDETNFKGLLGNIEDMKGDKQIDYQVLGEHLIKHGLQFSLQEREVDVLIITGAGGQPPANLN